MLQSAQIVRPEIPMPSRKPDEWMTPGEVARALGVSNASIQRWADAGARGPLHGVRTMRVGKHRRFWRADIEALVERSTQDSNDSEGNE